MNKYMLSVLLMFITMNAIADISANVSVGSDYVFRGVSQTDDGATIQGGIDWSNESGLFTGTWASNVDIASGDGVHTEWDIYGGYSADIGSVNVTGTVIRYMYPQANSGIDYDYTEYLLDAAMTDSITLSLGYSSDVFNTSKDGIFYGISYTKPINVLLEFEATAGYYDLEDAFNDNYTTYSVAVSADLAVVNITGMYVKNGKDADNIYGDIADDRFVVSATLNF